MSTVSFEIFVKQFKETLEISGDYFFNSELKDIKEYDSVGKIKISLLIEDIFNFQIELDMLIEKKDLRSLYEYCVSKS
tara:strand:- start:38312 stop:38545 length:234 start_codon:yes stop_codon:yes gene_type:complete